METVKSIKKKNLGTYDFSFDNEQKLLLVRWNDNSVVTVATNNCTIEPLVSAKRYNRKEKRKESIPQPKVIAEYNQHMGGVDLHDNGICNYRINVKGKKWWWPLFMNLIDSVIVNSWKIYNLANKSKMSQLEFKSNIEVTLMKMDEPAIENYIQGEERTESGDHVSCASRPNYGRPSKGSLPMDIRFDDIGHVIIEEENKARRRCRQCKSNTIYMCAKCHVHLHTNCFGPFHTKC
ncbi:piggyBac transposable element-derived protein 3-like [Belonocnema kinseyi]|uniref:piggyBac transposable element-derived protein 3-like n=1 Tax=Belonocnema kinseyi TaxID=2817044 RepID=UPI00143CF140|nr:piggyBac transposable element-derived protein 3-like [Belonocnema kinseyi]